MGDEDRRLRNHRGGLYATEDKSVGVRRVGRRKWEVGANKCTLASFDEPSIDSFDFNPQQFKSFREAQSVAKAGAKPKLPYHNRKGL